MKQVLEVGDNVTSKESFVVDRTSWSPEGEEQKSSILVPKGTKGKVSRTTFFMNRNLVNVDWEHPVNDNVSIYENKLEISGGFGHRLLVMLKMFVFKRVPIGKNIPV